MRRIGRSRVQRGFDDRFDFFSAKGMERDELTAVVSAWQAGAISRETMFDLFRRGEVLPAGRTDEEEARLADKQKAEIGKAEIEAARTE